MPNMTLSVPLSTDAFYEGERIARNEGQTLVGKIESWIAEYIDDADDLAALRDAMEEDDGTRYTTAQVREELGL